MMVDSGAQRSVVSSKLVEKIQFHVICVEKLALQGFNEWCPGSHIYKVVQIIMGNEGRRPILLEALIVKDIKEFVISGTAKFVKWVFKVASLVGYRLLGKSLISPEIYIA